MYRDIAEYAFKTIHALVQAALNKSFVDQIEDFFTRRRVKMAVETAVAAVVEQLIPFLANEGIGDPQQHAVIRVCVDELTVLASEPSRLFRGGLRGSDVFEELYEGRQFPELIREEGLEQVYALLGPRVATLLCEMPILIKEWQSEGWRENYRRFDELTTQLNQIIAQVDRLSPSADSTRDHVLQHSRRWITQQSALQLDLTGLRADQPLRARLKDMFVHPRLKLQSAQQDEFVDTVEQAYDRFLCHYRRGVIVGEPGVGKTTWSKWLVRTSLERWPGIAVRAELRKLMCEVLPSIQELIRQSLGEHLSEDLASDRIGRWLDDGRVLLIFDGFDEVAPSSRDDVLGWLRGLSDRIGKCPLFLTSRPLTTDHLKELGQWELWEALPFDVTRVVEYVNRWYKHAPLLPDSEREVDARALAEEWRSDPTLNPLTSNPLLLTTLLVVNHLDGTLPEGRASLYERYIEGMLGLWDDRKRDVGTHIELSRYQWRRLLRGVATGMHFAGRDAVLEDDFADLVGRELESLASALNPQPVLRWLRERSGLIVGPGEYSFIHKSVGEFLVAESIHQGDLKTSDGGRLDRLCLYSNRHDDRWNTVLFLWAGIAPLVDLENFLDTCLNDKPRGRDFALVLGVVGDQFVRIPLDVKRRILSAFLNASIDTPDMGSSGRIFPMGAMPVAWGAPPVTYSPNLRGIRQLHLLEIVGRLAAAVGWASLLRHSLPDGNERFLHSALVYSTEVGGLPEGDADAFNSYGYLCARMSYEAAECLWSEIPADEALARVISKVPALTEWTPFLLLGLLPTHFGLLGRRGGSILDLLLCATDAHPSDEALLLTSNVWFDSGAAILDPGPNSGDLLEMGERWLTRFVEGELSQVSPIDPRVASLREWLDLLRTRRYALRPRIGE